MPVIGIVDDRDEDLEQLKTALELESPDKWEAIPQSPFPELRDYISWITENKVATLLVDEKLDEVSPNPDFGAVSYRGHDLVDFLRARLPTLPIFIVTGYSTEPELIHRFGEVEGMIDKIEFHKNAEAYTQRITRAGQRFLDTFEAELATLSDFAFKSATGQQVTAEENQRAKAIQSQIGTAFPIDDISDRSQWLGEMEKAVRELEKLKDEMESLLENQDNNE